MLAASMRLVDNYTRFMRLLNAHFFDWVHSDYL